MKKSINALSIKEQKEYELALNKKAREEMKLKLLADIQANFIVCQFTGENPKNYLLELKEIIDSFLNKFKCKEESVMNEIFVKIMNLIEKETDMPLLERDVEKWLEKNEVNEVIHAIYVMASKARDL